MNRLLFVLPFLSSGGAERVVSIWSSELARLGYDVHLILFYRVEKEYALYEKVKVHTISDSKKSYKKLNPLRKIILIRKMLKEIKPEIIIPFITYVGILTNLARIGLKVKLIETIRNNPSYVPSSFIMRIFRNVSVYFSNYCIVQNNEQKEYFPNWFQKRIFVIKNPISNEFLMVRKEHIKKEELSIVSVGRLEPQKNYHLLINAFSQISEKYKNIKLFIYGEGSLHSELSNMIIQKRLENRVYLQGRVENIVEVLQSSDMYILTSNNEGMPNALMEAMAVGLPCISTDCPTGPSELITNKVNGYLIPVGDEDSLVEKMISILNNYEEAVKMGIKARETIISQYSIPKNIKELLNIINN